MSLAVDGGWPELDQANDNTLAWLANRLTDAEQGATWPSREAAVRAILTVNEELPEKDPRSGLLFRVLGLPYVEPWDRTDAWRPVSLGVR